MLHFGAAGSQDGARVAAAGREVGCRGSQDGGRAVGTLHAVGGTTTSSAPSSSSSSSVSPPGIETR